MSQPPILIQLPDEVYERLREIADGSHRPLESVLIDSLTLLLGELPSLTSQQLDQLTDEQLWAIVNRALAWPQDGRLGELTTLGKQGRLTDEQQIELERLVDDYDRYVLLRSQALLQLKQRGHDVEHRLKLGA